MYVSGRGASPIARNARLPRLGWGGERGKKGIEEYFNTKAVYISH